MLTKLLRFPVPDQIKALLEKIDNEGAALDSSSRYKIESLIREHNLTRYERYLLKQGLTKYERAKTLDRAMCIVLNQEDERDRAKKQIVNPISLLNGLSGTTVAMWNGAVPGQNAVQNTLYTDPRAIYQSAENYK
jgi:hypothetical protein